MQTIWYRVVFNGLWLLVPVMVWNAALTAKLPPAFSRDIFWNAIPSLISIPENILRIVLFALPSVTVCGAYSTHKRGYILFILGLAAYFASWLLLIFQPMSKWSLSLIGFLAPAYTPVLWLGGIALIIESYVCHAQWNRFAFFVTATAFLSVHVTHAFIIYQREY